MSRVQTIKLADGHVIPQIGLGLWQLTDPEKFKTAFKAAIAAGYRHFDTAQAYHNEQLLGAAIKESGVKRQDLFITTKIAVQNFGDKKSRSTFKQSLKRLDTDYVDLILLHFPLPLLRKKTWRVLESLKAEGLAKSIGVSNFTINHLRQLEKYAKDMPVVNQVEMHLFLQQADLVQYCQSKKIVVEAYSPLAHAKAMDNKVISELADKYGRSYAQIMLRWAIQKGVVVIPKSANPKRIKDNIQVTDFVISDSDMLALSSLNKDLHTCWNPELVP